jgi:tetratricopeptide (TPR) repeat protein
MARDLHGHNVCAEISPKALSRLNFQVKQSEKFGLGLASLYLSVRGDREGALALSEEAVTLKRVTRVDEPLEVANSLNNLGLRYVNLGRLDDAEAAFREALAIKEPRLDPNDPSLAITLGNLAGVHWRRKDFDQAEPLYLRAADIMKAAHGAGSAEYGVALSNLGQLYGDWADAPGQAARRAQEEEYKTKDFSITLAARGPRHPEAAISHNNLAVMNTKRGNWRGAEAEMEREVAIMLSLDLSQHGDMPSDLANLARCWQQCGQGDKAARLRRGDISDLIPVIRQIEAEHRAWVAADPNTPKTRDFGPPPPNYTTLRLPSAGGDADKEAEMEKFFAALAAAGVDAKDLMRRVQSGELSQEAAQKIVTEALAGKQ